MSNYTDEYEDIAMPRYQRKTLWIVAVVFLCLLAAGVGVFSYMGMSEAPDIHKLTIEADPNTKIYFGDKLVGTTQATLTWEELFGDEKHEALAMRMPGFDKLPEFASGAGAKVLEHQHFEGLMLLDMSVNGERYMMRRADGALDDVLCYVLYLGPRGHSSDFVLPVRLRKGKGASTAYFNKTGFTSSSTEDLLHLRPSESTRRWSFSAGAPPSQFAEEIKTKSLWEPGGEK